MIGMLFYVDYLNNEQKIEYKKKQKNKLKKAWYYLL